MTEQEILSLVNKMNNKPKFKYNFTKVLMSIITGLFVISYITCLILFITGNPVPMELLNVINNVFMVGWVGYAGKSGLENFQKIKQNQPIEDSNMGGGQ